MRKFAGVCYFAMALAAGLALIDSSGSPWIKFAIVGVLLIAAVQAFETDTGGWVYEQVTGMFGAAAVGIFGLAVLVALYLWLEPTLKEAARVRASNKAFAASIDRCRNLVQSGKYQIVFDGEYARGRTITDCALKMTEPSPQPQPVDRHGD